MAADSRVDAVIDEQGRLFGLVNVVDALVVLLVLAVLVSGFVLLVPEAEGGQATRYATIDAGAQPAFIAWQITAGDRWELDDRGENLTVTDVYTYPRSGEDESGVSVLIRARVNGSAVEEEEEEAAAGPIEFGGETLRYGRTLAIATDDYLVEGTVVDIGRTGAALETEPRALVVQTEVGRATAAVVQPGDDYRIGGDPIVTVESVTVYPTGDPGVRRVVLGVTANARVERGAAFLGDTPLRTGVTLPIRTNSYALSGTVIRLGSLEEPGVPATRNVTMRVADVPSYRANAIVPGMTESVGEVETARVVSRGNVSAAGFDMTAELSVRERDDGTVRFRGEPLRIGEPLTLDLEAVTVTGVVTNVSAAAGPAP